MAGEKLAQKSKDKFFRGQTVEELKKLSIREFAKLINSRERRTVLRNTDVVEAFVNRCEKRTAKNRPIKTHSRALVIVPALVGKTIGVYNGKEFVQVKILDEMLGHRLGEFSLTRRGVKHGAAGVGATKSSASASVK